MKQPIHNIQHSRVKRIPRSKVLPLAVRKSLRQYIHDHNRKLAEVAILIGGGVGIHTLSRALNGKSIDKANFELITNFAEGVRATSAA